MNLDTNDASSIHKKIVEQLAATVNGCLAELGYFPGTIQKLQQLENEVVRLRAENDTLFSDNRKLVHWNQAAKVELDKLRAELHRLGRVIPSQVPGQPVHQPMHQPLHHPPPGMILIPSPTAFVAPPHQMVQHPQANARPGPSSRRVSLPSIQTGTLPPPYPPTSAPPASSPRSSIPVHMNMPPPQATRISRPRSLHNSPITQTPQAHIALSIPTQVPSSPSTRHPPFIAAPVPGPPSGPISAALQGWKSQTKSPAEVIDLTSLDNDEPESISEAPRKKQRVDPAQAIFSPEGQLQQNIAQSSTSVTPTNTVPAPSEIVPDSPRDVQMQSAEGQTGENTQDVDDDDMDVEEVELDEDGLVPLDYCLDVAFTPDEGSGRICKMCNARHEIMIKEDPNAPGPKPFVNADATALIEHCEKEHPVGWASLRSPPDA
ncbi:hypothetical protein QCA50_000967 [Cerrena zonata]|uniref:Uncharacterized protein n=1 Tax=Cerrena zonata TaxID=2478898 RepID=A0AAW0GRV2_9APHY